MDLSQISTEELLRMRNDIEPNSQSQPNMVATSDLSNISTEELLKMRTDNFLNKIGTSLPIDERSFQDLQWMATTLPESAGSYNTIKKQYTEETERRKAYLELSKNFGPEQIKDYITTKKALQPSWIKEQLGQTAGGTVGAIGGGIVGAPWGPPGVAIGAIAGAGILGAAGKGIQQAIDPYQDVSLKDMLMSGGEELVLEGVTRGVGKGLKLGAKKLFGSKGIAESKDVMEFFAKEMDGLLPPSATNKSAWHMFMERISRTSFISDEMWQEFDAINKAKYDELGPKIVSSIGGKMVDDDPTRAGRLFFEQISRSGQQIHGPLDVARKTTKGRILQQLSDTVNPLYSKFDELTAGKGISIKNIQEWTAAKLAADVRTNSLPDVVKKELKKILKMAPGGTRDPVSKKFLPKGYLTAQEINRDVRSSILSLQRELQAGQKAGAKEIGEIGSKWSELLFEAENTPGLTQKSRLILHNANQIKKAGETFLESPDFSFAMARKLADNPQKARELLFPKGAKPDSGALQSIQTLKEGLIYETGPYLKLRAGVKGGKLVKSVEGTVVWDSLRKSWMSAEIASGTLDNTIKKMGPAMDVMFSPDELKNTRLYLETGEKIIPRGGMGGGSLSVRSAQIRKGTQGLTSAGLLLYGANTENKKNSSVAIGAGGLILLGPYAYARLAISGKVGQGFIKELAEHNAKPVKTAVAPLAARLTKYFISEDEAEQSRILNERRRRAYEDNFRKQIAEKGYFDNQIK